MYLLVIDGGRQGQSCKLAMAGSGGIPSCTRAIVVDRIIAEPKALEPGLPGDTGPVSEVPAGTFRSQRRVNSNPNPPWFPHEIKKGYGKLFGADAIWVHEGGPKDEIEGFGQMCCISLL